MTEKEKSKLDVLFKMFKVHFPDDPDKGIYGKLNEIDKHFLETTIKLNNRIEILESRMNNRHIMKLMVGSGIVSLCVALILVIFKKWILN